MSRYPTNRSSTSFSSDKDDVDLETKLMDWENFYNFARPHGAFDGKTPENPYASTTDQH